MSEIDSENNFRFSQGESYNFNPVKTKDNGLILWFHFSIWQSPDGTMLQPSWGQAWEPTQGDAIDVAVREGRKSIKEANQGHFIMVMANAFAVQLADDGNIVLNKTD